MILLGRFFKSRYFVWAILGAPLVVMSVNYADGRLFYGEVVHLSGELSIRLLILTMAVTPLSLMFPGRSLSKWLIKNRRYFGVSSFGYALFHTAIYANKVSALPDILTEALLPEYLFGWLAVIILTALALTSNDYSLLRLKGLWKKIHRLVYVAAFFGFLHFIIVAFNRGPALMHLVILAVFEVYRVWKLSSHKQPS